MQGTFDTVPTSIEHIRAGRIRALGVTTATRLEALPGIPAVGEFVPDYEVSGWQGLQVPTGTPNEIISRLHAESMKALSRQDVRERLSASGIEPSGSSPEQFGGHIRSEIAKWAKVVKTTGARAD